MSLEVYYPQDILNALLAAEQAAGATAEATGGSPVPSGPGPVRPGQGTGRCEDTFTAGFLTGYRAALIAIALAFGLVQFCDDADEKHPYVNEKQYFARNTLHTLK